MKSAFDAIRYGPFAAKYHQQAADEIFAQALREFLERDLLPQVVDPFESTKGRLSSQYDEDRFCGPNSAVKDVYLLEFSFVRAGSSDDVRGEVCNLPAQRKFQLRNPKLPLVLWTKHRRDSEAEFRRKIDAIAAEVRSGSTVGLCPRCASSLLIINSPAKFHISCIKHCFDYDYHRDPATGEFLHGHFFSKPQTA